ncbi:hypothetical protein B0H19DRAFT_326608 [Mycena capillaripes]|nr:hypothetical protein B0H19DRAFT_326608 [Mycena capillaripes]
MSHTKQQLRAALKAESFNSPFGPGPKTPGRFHPLDIIGSLEEFGSLDLISALDRLDTLLPSVHLTTDLTSTAKESQASKNLGIDALQSILMDPTWVDDLLDIPTSWKQKMAKDFNLDDLQLGKRDTIIDEHAEVVVDDFAKTQAALADAACDIFPGVGPKGITAKQQKSTPIPSGGSVTPDVLFYSHTQDSRSMPANLFERRENKTLEVMFYHAHELNEATGKSLDKITSKPVRGVFTQAFTSSRTHTERCNIVWMGHPSLYRICYIYQNCLYVSNWRSTEPRRIRSLLQLHKPWPEITQSHLIRETLGLANIDMDAFIAARRCKGVVAKMVHFLPSPFEILSRLTTSRIVLGEDNFYGTPKFFGESLPLVFLITMKPRFVWGNSAVVAKAVDSDELEIWKNLSKTQISGLPAFKGVMTISSKPNTGRTLIFLSNCGDAVGEALEYDDEEESVRIRSHVCSTLRALWRHGLHHHDIHGGNVLRNGDLIYVTDFGKAVKAEECALGKECPDHEFLVEYEEPSMDVLGVPELVHSLSQSSAGSPNPTPYSSPPQPQWPPKS